VILKGQRRLRWLFLFGSLDTLGAESEKFHPEGQGIGLDDHEEHIRRMLAE
jgi:hypothetical protein